jgi:hypothetical protein
MINDSASGAKNGDLEQAPPASEEGTWSMIDLLVRKFPISYKSLLIAAALQIGQQLSGINSILLFSDSIFSTGSSQSLVPTIIASINFVMTILAIFAIDRAGRRVLALTSSGAMALAGMMLTLSFALGWKVPSIASVLVFVGAFAFGLGPVPWLMTNELFPTVAVGSAVSLAVTLNWITNMAVTTSFLPISDALGPYAFVPYTASMALFFVFALLVMPETKGRTVAFVEHFTVNS